MSIYKAADIIKSCNNIVFFGGAGVSTECGIPDFRSEDGLYNKKNKFPYSPEEMLSHSFFERHPDIFYKYLKESLLKYNVQPNFGHKSLAALEKMGKLKAVITQNIDGLHQKAGSKNVLELHGTLSRFYCSKCFKEYSPEFITEEKFIPICNCKGIIRPDVVLYEEALNQEVILKSIDYISKAKVLIVAGTSLVVYPAAGMIRYFKGDKIIFINKSSTSYDSMADIVINEPFSKTMERIMKEAGF